MKLNRVLIVDDKEENTYLLSALLQGHGYEPVTAHHGAEALILARQNPPDLIISDLLMPVMDGYTLLRHWKTDPRLRTIPFVVYTATYTDPKDEQLALNLGADDFILKPTEPEPFVERINNLMQKAKNGQLSPVRIAHLDSNGLVKEYDEVLVRKLEEKALQLTEANRALQADVAERKRMEAALAQSESHLRSVVQSAGDAIITMDAEGMVRFWNSAAETTFGFSSAEIIGTPLMKVLPDRFHGDFQKRPQPQLMTGQLILGQRPMEVVGLRKDGTEFPAEITISSWKGKEGTFSTAIVRDISERKRADELIRKRLQELEGMNRVSTVLRIASTMEQMLSHLLEESLKILDGETGAVWLLDTVLKSLRRMAARGWMAEKTSPESALGESFPGALFSIGSVGLSEDISADSAIPQATGFPSGRAAVWVPVRSEREMIGLIFIARQQRPFAPEEVNLLVTLSEMAGTAVQRTRLNEQMAGQLKRLSALHAIDTAITGSMNLNVTLGYFLDQALAQLRIDAAAILKGDTHLKTLEYLAGRGFRGAAITGTRLRFGEGHSGRAAVDRRTFFVSDMQKEPIAHPERVAGEGFVTHIAVPLVAKGQVNGILELFHRSEFSPGDDWLSFLSTLAGQAAIAIDNATLFTDLQDANDKLSRAYDATLEGWSQAMDLRDKETEGHSQRVTETTVALAQRLGLSDDQLVHMRRGALLHDLGKLGVPDSILNKKGSLTDGEWEIMRRHPMLAHKMLAPIDYLRPALDIPYCHHERWDGSGYPRGLKGDQIPFAARIFAVADVFDALTSDRPYRAAWSRSKAREYIQEQSGKGFDPQVVDAFLRLER